MQDIQAVFMRIEETKKKMKDLKSAYSDALKNAQEYQEVLDKQKSIRERKKQIEQAIKDQFSSELMKLEDLKIDMASDMELLSDMAMTQMMKGETVQVTDPYNNTFEPVFAVKFKKVS